MINSLDYLLSKLRVSGVIENEIIDFKNQHIALSTIRGDVEFVDCHIIALSFTFKNIDNVNLNITFDNCTLDTHLKITESQFNNFDIINPQQLNSLHIHSSDLNNPVVLNRLTFIRNETLYPLKIDIFISNTNFLSEFHVSNLIMDGGSFVLIKSRFKKNEDYYYYKMTNSKFYNLCLQENNFETITGFQNCSFDYSNMERTRYKKTLFWGNSYDKIGFTNCCFYNNVEFANCIFEDVAIFENNVDSNNSILDLKNCKFKGHASFNNSKFFNLNISQSNFNDTASFQDLKTTQIILDKTSFEKISYFDNLFIENIKTSDRKTLLNIKQQLQKADNRIDYNRFRAYELYAYYKELKWWGNFKDKFILGLTWLATGFDHSWRRALFFTLAGGMLFYSLLYFIEFYVALNLNNDDNFTAGAFRFFMVTDFSSPFLQKEYLNNGYSWTIFVLGKIVIAFGIYEMIQAFRKFKA